MNPARAVSPICASKVAGAWSVLLLLTAVSPAYSHQIDKHFAVQLHPVITIHNANGDITIKSWGKPEVEVAADHRSQKVEVDTEQTGNRIDLVTHLLTENIDPDELKADYNLTVPADAELQIHNDSGTVTASNIQGDMTIETVSAPVQLEDAAGYLMVKTVGGSFECLRCSGRIEVQSISGSLQLLDDRSASILAQTSTGNILFNGAFLPNGIYRLKNYSGFIEVRFSPADSFDVSATSLYGKVDNQAKLIPPLHPNHMPPRFARSLFGTLNQGRAKLELTSFSGTIDIHKRE